MKMADDGLEWVDSWWFHDDLYCEMVVYMMVKGWLNNEVTVKWFNQFVFLGHQLLVVLDHQL